MDRDRLDVFGDQIVSGLRQHLRPDLRHAVSQRVELQKQARTSTQAFAPSGGKPAAWQGLPQPANIVEKDD